MSDAGDEQHWTEFDQAGEKIVQQYLAANRYGEGKRAQAKAWLAHQSESRSETSSREQRRIARSTKNAAWAAAIAAIVAAIAAIISIAASN